MQRKIRFSLKIDRDRYIYDLSELNNINLDLFIEHFDNGILSDWLYIHNHNKEYQDIENLKKELYDLEQEKKDEHKIISLSKIFDFNNSDVEKFIRKIQNEKNNINNNIEKLDLSIEFNKYSEIKKSIENNFKVDKETYYGMKYISKYLEPSKNNFLILKNLSSILEFWKDVPLILENFRNEFKLKELQPILYYLILSSKFKYLNYTLFEKNQKYFENTLLEKNINDQSFIDFYIKNTNLFKKFDENNSSGVESNVIVIKNEGFDIGNVNPLESTEKIYFKLNSKKASLVLLMLDHIEV